jgi:hypothetical protein
VDWLVKVNVPKKRGVFIFRVEDELGLREAIYI